MSGGKETPRQKMIGMMYLVLTALLALNVSNAVMEKFAIIDDTLKEGIISTSATNEKKTKDIQSASSSQEKVLAAKDIAAKIRLLTKTTIASLDVLKTQLATEEDGKAIERAELVTNLNRAEEIMINHSMPEAGQNYEKLLSAYITELNKHMGDRVKKLKSPFKKLTRTALDYDEFKDGPHKDKPFLEFSFEQVPTIAAIATISETQSEILKDEADCLDILYGEADAVNLKVDQLVPMVQADAHNFVPGQSYEGNLFVAGSSSGVNPEMFFGNSPLKVEELEVSRGIKIKMGKIKFLVRGASNYDAFGRAKASFHVKINLPGTGLPPLDEDIEYNVLRPAPKFASAAASTLYRNCGNLTDVTIPGLTDVSNLSLSVPPNEGTVIKISSGKFAIIPTRPECNVSVLMDGINVYTEHFKSKDVPQPVGRVMFGNSSYNKDLGLPPGTPQIRIEPFILDKEFVNNNPKDSKYQVRSCVVEIRGAQVQLPSGSINLTQYGLKSGDSFTIKQVKVFRNTYDGKQEEVLGSEMTTTVRIAK